MTERPTKTVRERIRDELDGRIHGMAVTAQRGNTSYVVVSRSTEGDRGDRVELTTVVVDLDTENVQPIGNSMWVPREAGALDALTQVLARSTTDVTSADTRSAPPLETGVGDVAGLLATQVATDDGGRDGQDVDKMKRHTGIDPARSWGYVAGPPPEVETVHGRLADAGLDPAEHYIRLVFGKKEPMERRVSDHTPAKRPPDELKGNYGIELLPRDSGLVAIDVDYPAAFPGDVDLPETFEVSSPHGDDSQRHILLRCEDKEALAADVGAWAVQAVDWGDLWIGDRFLVGPGSQLSEYGCDDGDHERSEKGGCEGCEDPESGFYRVVNDAPIATVDADVIMALLDASSGYDLRDGPADNQPPASEDDDEDDPLTCDSCGTTHANENAMKELAIGDSTRRICRGGCDA
jgi:hypothetical protein